MGMLVGWGKTLHLVWFNYCYHDHFGILKHAINTQNHCQCPFKQRCKTNPVSYLSMGINGSCWYTV